MKKTAALLCVLTMVLSGGVFSYGESWTDADRFVVNVDELAEDVNEPVETVADLAAEDDLNEDFREDLGAEEPDGENGEPDQQRDRVEDEAGQLALTDAEAAALSGLNVVSIQGSALQGVQASDGVLGVVRNFQELQDALALDGLAGAYLFNDIQMESALTIDRNFRFERLLGDVVLYAAPGERHFKIERSGYRVTVDFGGVILDGGSDGPNSLGGGLDLSGNSSSAKTITNGVIRNCNATAGGSAIALRGGFVDIRNFDIYDNYSKDDGAAIAAISLWELAIEDCRIYDNDTVRYGGAIYASAVRELTIFNCDVYGNVSKYGGAVAIFDGTAEIDNCRISENIGGSQGGGGLQAQSLVSLTISNSDLLRNTAPDGGAMFIYDTPTRIEDCRISENTAVAQGGAMEIGTSYGIHDTSIVNCELTGNSAVRGGAIYAWDLNTLYVDENTVFTENSANGGKFMISASDIALHNEHIKTRQFTAPFFYGYNNVDIYYAVGLPPEFTVVIDFHLSKSEPAPYFSKALVFDSSLNDYPSDQHPPTPEIEGLEFAGWYDIDGNQFTNSTVVPRNISVYAHWMLP